MYIWSLPIVYTMTDVDAVGQCFYHLLQGLPFGLFKGGVKVSLGNAEWYRNSYGY